MTGKKYDQDKTRFDLLDDRQTEKIAEVLTFGAKKYSDDNWKNVKPFKSRYNAAIQRHLTAYRKGEKIDQDSGLTHLAHAATCLHFLMWGEDNLFSLSNLRIGLDIDGVLAGFRTSVYEKYDLQTDNKSWKFSYIISKLWKDIEGKEAFWANIKPLCKPEDIPFEPVLYCTNRHQPKEWIERWIEKNNFPCCKVVSNVQVKSEILKQNDIDIFIEDKYVNYKEIKNAGIQCFLLTRDWNQKHDVGYDRIETLNDLKFKL